MSEFATSPTPTTIRIERRLPGPIERVWSYLVDGEKRALWFCGGSVEPRVGGVATAVFDHTKLSHEPTPEAWKAFDGVTSTGEVTRWDPPRVFAYKTNWDGNESEIIFELKPLDEGVLLSITQTKMRSAEEKANYAMGWHAHLDTLEDRLRGVEPRGFWTNFDRLQKAYETRF